MDYKLLKNLPSPFYRISVKAIILDEKKRLLVGRGEEDSEGWEIPGGGFEHDEKLEECLSREVEEEIGAEVTEVGEVAFVYRGRSVHGWMILRIAVPVRIKNHDFKFGDIKEVNFVTKKEFLSLKFAAEEGTIKDYVDYIWL